METTTDEARVKTQQEDVRSKTAMLPSIRPTPQPLRPAYGEHCDEPGTTKGNYPPVTMSLRLIAKLWAREMRLERE